MMKHLLALLAFGIAPALIGSPATAETPAERYAACLVQNHPDQVRELLGARTAEAASRPYQRLASDDRCLGQVFANGQFTPDEAGVAMDMLRGRLAEQAIRAQSTNVAALQPLPLQQKRYIRPWFVATGRHPAVDEMAACMADIDPAGISALVQTAPRSDDENSAIAAMSPSLTKCLSAGTRLDASREALRAALADALYERLNNPALSLANVRTERDH